MYDSLTVCKHLRCEFCPCTCISIFSHELQISTNVHLSPVRMDLRLIVLMKWMVTPASANRALLVKIVTFVSYQTGCLSSPIDHLTVWLFGATPEFTGYLKYGFLTTKWKLLFESYTKVGGLRRKACPSCHAKELQSWDLRQVGKGYVFGKPERCLNSARLPGVQWKTPLVWQGKKQLTCHLLCELHKSESKY